MVPVCTARFDLCCMPRLHKEMHTSTCCVIRHRAGSRVESTSKKRSMKKAPNEHIFLYLINYIRNVYMLIVSDFRLFSSVF